MRASKVLALSLLLTASLITACGPSDEEIEATSTAETVNLAATQTAATPTPTPEPTATPLPTPTSTPEPTATPVPFRSLLETSLEAMEQAESYHLKIWMHIGMVGEGFELGFPFTFNGDFQAPDRLQGLVAMNIMGQRFDFEMITIGDQAYLYDREVGEWQAAPAEEISPFYGITLNEEIANPKESVLVGIEKLPASAYHIVAVLPSETLADGLGEGHEDFEANYWIGVEDNLLHKISIEGALVATDLIPDLDQDAAINLLLEIVFSDYGKSVTIEAPEIE